MCRRIVEDETTGRMLGRRITGSEIAMDPESTVAAAGYTGCMRVGAMGGRVVPSESDTNGYTTW